MGSVTIHSSTVHSSTSFFTFATMAFDFYQATNTLGDGQVLDSRFNWVFWTLMAFNVFALAYVRTLHGQYIRVLFRTSIYNRQLYQNIQEDLRLGGSGSVLLTISYFNCLAVIVVKLVPGAPAWLAFVVLGGIIGLVLLKYMLMKLTSFITQTREGISEHWMNHLIFFQVSGILLTPILCFSHFSDQSIQNEVFSLMLIVIATMIFYREFQTLLRVTRLRLPLFYIILYLCTLEIMPLVVAIKALSG